MTQVDAQQSGEPHDAESRSGSAAKTRAIIVWAAIGVLFLAAAASAVGSLERTVYGARGVVNEYFDALQRGDAAAALEVPGVALDAAGLQAAGLPENASTAMLRRDVMPDPTEVQFVSDTVDAKGVHEVTYSYELDGTAGQTTFRLTKVGGLFGHWEFVTSPLAAVNLTVKHSSVFEMNGFALDTRQVSEKGAKAHFENIANILVFTPGSYTFKTDTDFVVSEDKRVFADAPANVEEASLDAEPTDALVDAVQKQFDAQLDACAKQVVLQPTGCPFGYHVSDRVSGQPAWSIGSYPDITLTPGSDSWLIPAVDGVATIDVDIQSLADGSVRNVSDSVPFTASGAVYLFSDGTLTTQLLTE
ncbi:hypothetical protein SAMN04489806_1620 [Paramicrobacterium humi]|uniref:Uncharacterized protein n=1 Tax=Paramicrobacterium humi TaxID=640635 RepID=A0A1H4LPZ4_9MICO|nr:hypothetical protein [Microbacterium humi]SEB72708.1 hypothetical protein SAMN04489806_1620 [Microbacterium humi]